jgi:hypothetical protein
MKTAIGNDKLGKNCIVVSRPVGDTCPSSCGYLNNGCYAQQSEKQYPAVRPAGFQNLITEKQKIRAMILDAAKQGKSIRLGERGDFNKNEMDADGNILVEKLDEEYIGNIEWACESIVKSGVKLPRMWFYTHVYHSRIAALSKYMAAYASVENAEQLKQAKAAGFTMFAWCDIDQKIAPKRPKSAKKRVEWKAALPTLHVIEGEQFVTCPEIRKGRDFVTCSGITDKKTGEVISRACNLCIYSRKNVLFPSH